MSHHRHPMECWLSIEEYKVSILKAPLHNDSLIDLLPNLFLSISEVKCEGLKALLTGLRVCSWDYYEFDLVALRQLNNPIYVVLSDFFRDCELLSYCLWYS